MAMSQIYDQSELQKQLETFSCVVVDFSAHWCGPCRRIKPMLEALAAEHANRIKFLVVDVDVSHGLVETYGVRSMPTLLFFRDGAVRERINGADTTLIKTAVSNLIV